MSAQDNAVAGLLLPASLLYRALNNVRQAASSDRTLPMLCAVRLLGNSSGFQAVATDRYVLVSQTLHGQGWDFPEVSLPRAEAQRLTTALRPWKIKPGNVRLWLLEQMLVVEFPDGSKAGYPVPVQENFLDFEALRRGLPQQELPTYTSLGVTPRLLAVLGALVLDDAEQPLALHLPQQERRSIYVTASGPGWSLWAVLIPARTLGAHRGEDQ